MSDPQHIHPELTSGKHISYWTSSVKPLEYTPLNQSTATEVVIVGAGIAGLTIAYCLLKSGKKVIVVEDGFIGSGETGRTSAHLLNALDDRYYEIERIYGAEKAKKAAASHSKAIDEVEKIVQEQKIDCGFKRLDGYLFLHESDKKENLDKELQAARKSGLDVLKVNTVPAFPDKQEALKFPRQAQFHPMKYLEGLCEAIIKMGGKIYTSTHAKEISAEGIVTSGGNTVKADHIVVATNAPVNSKYTLPMKQYAYRTYVVALKINKGSVPEALWWDTGDFDHNKNIPPYHYVRTQPLNETSDLLIVGGEDHPVGLADADGVNEEQRYKLLTDWVKRNMGITSEVAYAWSGEVMEPMDSLAYIGRSPFDKDNVYMVTGDSGNGLTHGTIAGLLITDLINGKENEWKDLYDPRRFKLKSTGVALKEFTGGLAAYLKTKPKDTDKIKLQDIPAGEGRIVELEGKKIGAYRDAGNDLHFVGAECTHMGCIVKWNNDEKSWDCPCHGSRFSHKGDVLNGPAIENLLYHKHASQQDTSGGASSTAG